MEVARELEEEYMATLVTLPTKVPALHEKKNRRAISTAGGNVSEGRTAGAGGPSCAPDSAPEDLEVLKAWLRELKPNFERYLPNFEHSPSLQPPGTLDHRTSHTTISGQRIPRS
jgi:hypothetical protein